jgi:hypothetical protein
MTKVTPKSIGEFLIQNWKNIALIIFALIFLYQCNGNNDLELANSSLKKQAEGHLKNAKMFEEKNFYLQDDLVRYEDSVSKLKDKEKKLIADRIVIIKNTNSKIEKIKKYNSSQIAQYIQNRYGVDSTQVQTTNIGTAIKDDTAKDILTELEQGDGCEAEIVKVEQLYLNEKEVVKQKDSVIVNVTEQKDNLSLAIIEYQSANELKQNALENTEKLFKKEKNKKNIWKLTTFAVVVSAITKGIIDNK